MQRKHRTLRVVYEFDGMTYSSRELLRAFHPEGDAVIAYADGGWSKNQEYAPGFNAELAETVRRTGAMRFREVEIDLLGKVELIKY